MKKIYVARRTTGIFSKRFLVGEEGLASIAGDQQFDGAEITVVEPWEASASIQLMAMEEGDRITHIRMGQLVETLVTKVTNTQVTIGNTRYVKSTAKEIGTKYRRWVGIASPNHIENLKYEQSKHEARRRWGKAAEVIADEIITSLYQADKNGTVQILKEKLAQTGLINMKKINELIL